ncbi:MAG: cytochrome c [Bacteroidetes bacterium]|nr:MAG: cytochrome c [Bacteroidota bacterium]
MFQTRTFSIISISLLMAGSLAISQCKKKTEDTGNEPAQETAEATTEAAPNAADVAAGHELFKKNGCVTCHGEGGKGDGPSGPALKARNLTKPDTFKQGTSQAEIAKTISTGIPGTGMAPYASISEADRMKIAAWIKSIQK